MRYHPNAISIKQLGPKFENYNEKRRLIEDYFERRKKVLGDKENLSKVKKSKTCSVVGCQSSRFRSSLCSDHYKIGVSIVRNVDGRMCPVESCLNKVFTTGTCLFHKINDSTEAANDIELEQVDEIAANAAAKIIDLAEKRPLDKFYVGISQNYIWRGEQHRQKKGKTSNWAEQIELIPKVANWDVVNALEHRVLDVTAKSIDSRRFVNDQPGGGHKPKNENRPGSVYLLTFKNAFDPNKAAKEPEKDFSGGATNFPSRMQVAYPDMRLPKIKERISVNKALRLLGFVVKDMRPSIARNETFKCDMCPASFSSKFAIGRHMPVHKSKMEKCSVQSCQFQTKHHSSMRAHMKRVHEISLPNKSTKLTHVTIKCEYCPKEMRKESLKIAICRLVFFY